VQWLEEQLRCERAFNEDLKARLQDMEAQNETDVSCDCNKRQINDKAKETVVRYYLYPVPYISSAMIAMLLLSIFGSLKFRHLSWRNASNYVRTGIAQLASYFITLDNNLGYNR